MLRVHPAHYAGESIVSLVALLAGPESPPLDRGGVNDQSSYVHEFALLARSAFARLPARKES